MAVALLALVVALSGSAYAVTKVGTKQIKSNAVTTPKIRNGAVTAAKMAPGVVPNGNSSYTLAPSIDLSDSLQQVIEQKVKARKGQTVMVSSSVNAYQFGAGSDTRIQCTLLATPPGGSISGTISPYVTVGIGTDSQYVQVPILGNFKLADSPGLWTFWTGCRKNGSGGVSIVSSAIQASVVRP